jgi:general secretion pathway protein L
VAIVARALLDTWLERCAAAGLSPHAVYAETEGVPDTPGSLTLIVEGERTYGRRGGDAPFVLEGLGITEMLELMGGGRQDDSAVRHVVIYADEAGHARCEGELGPLREQLSSVDLQLLPDGPLPRLGATLINQRGANLLQGPYAPKSNWGALVRPWRFAAGLLLGLCVLMILTEGARYFFLNRQDQALASLLEAACQRSFQAPRLATCQSEVRRRLAASGAAADAGNERGFLVALAAVAEARDPQSRIEALSFRNGVLDLRVLAPSVPALDAFAQNLGSGGQFEVNIQSANPADDGVEGRLQVVGTR